MRRLSFAVLVTVVTALYEEPPGGCQGPPPDDDYPFAAAKAAAQSQQAPQAIKRPKYKPPPNEPEPPPPTPEEMEKALYESEMLLTQLAGLGGDEETDWEYIENQKIRDAELRKAIGAIAVMLSCAYVLYKIAMYAKEQQEAAAKEAGAGQKTPTADELAAKDKAELEAKKKAEAKEQQADRDGAPPPSPPSGEEGEESVKVSSPSKKKDD